MGAAERRRRSRRRSRRRVACGFVKRHRSRWEDDLGEKAKLLLSELVDRVRWDDPVRGQWAVSSKIGTLWCDASSLAIGSALEVDGDTVEDAAWLRKRDDGCHINLAEMDSVIRGVNLAAKWGIKELEIMTDSATVLGWLRSALLDTHKVQNKGMTEILVKRRLSVLRDLSKRSMCVEHHTII